MPLQPPPSPVELVRKNGFADATWKKWLNSIYNYFGGDLWDDELTSLIPSRPGATAPTLTAFGPTGTNEALVFAVNDLVYTPGFHIRHTIKPNSKIYFHVHWSTDGISTNTVKWELSITYAKGHNQEAFPADTVVNLEEAASGTAWQHMITEMSDAQAITAPEVDSVVMVRLRRVTNGGTNNTDDVFGLFVDIHFQKDRFGTPNKAPDFYRR